MRRAEAEAAAAARRLEEAAQGESTPAVKNARADAEPAGVTQQTQGEAAAAAGGAAAVRPKGADEGTAKKEEETRERVEDGKEERGEE